MPIQILNRWNGRVVYESQTADSVRDAVIEATRKGANLSSAVLSSADLRSAVLRGADLRGADLRGADLRGADLRGADLRGADLRGADLRGADLRGADLRGADLSSERGISKYLVSPLYMLLDQPGKIRAYKLVTQDGWGPFQGGIQYNLGAHIECPADPDETENCSYGINIATLDWVMREWSTGMRILAVEHEAKDIACIPLGTDGKYRVHRVDVVGEKNLEELGLINGKISTEAKVTA